MSATRHLPLVLLAAALFGSAAMLNGYPLVFPDTGTYVYFSQISGLPEDRPVFYSWFIRASRLLGHIPLWGVVLVQSLLASVAVWATAVCVGLESRLRLLLTAAGLALFSSLPWFAGQIMPDVFSGIGLLAAFVLARCGAAEGRHRAVRWFLLLLMALACAVHFSNAAVIAGTLLVMAAMDLLIRESSEAARNECRGRLKRTVVLALVPVLVFVANQIWASSRGVQPSAQHFLAHRLVQDGLMQRLLLDHCPQRHYILCPYADQVKPQYLWWQGGPFERIGGFASPPEETWRMVLDSIRYYPAENLVAALSGTAAQLGKFQTGDGLRKYGPHMGVTRHLAGAFPEEFPQYMDSRQQRDELQPLIKAIRVPHTVVGTAAILLLVVVALSVSRASRISVDLSRFVLTALVLNAAVCGVLAGAYDRYGSRIVWVVVLASMLVLALRAEQGGSRAAFTAASRAR